MDRPFKIGDYVVAIKQAAEYQYQIEIGKKYLVIELSLDNIKVDTTAYGGHGWWHHTLFKKASNINRNLPDWF